MKNYLNNAPLLKNSILRTMDSENNLKKLAIYYGWPYAVRDLSEEPSSLEHAVRVFSQFDLIVLGAGLESPEHGDHKNTKYIVEKLSGRGVQGYIHLGRTKDYRCFSDDELVEKLTKWRSMGVNGVLVDLIGPNYNASLERVAGVARAAHDIGLYITYNSEFGAVDEGWFKERIMPSARAGDLVLLEKFGTSWESEFYPMPERLPQQMADLQNRGIAIIGVSTYDAEKVSITTQEGMEILMKRFLHYRAEAIRLNLDGYQFTNGLYSASGPEANILVDFDALVT